MTDQAKVNGTTSADSVVQRVVGIYLVILTESGASWIRGFVDERDARYAFERSEAFYQFEGSRPAAIELHYLPPAGSNEQSKVLESKQVSPEGRR